MHNNDRAHTINWISGIEKIEEQISQKFVLFGNSIEFTIQGQNFINFVRIVMRTQ